MEFGGFVIIALVWFLLNLVGKGLGKKQPQAERGRAPRTGPPPLARPLPHDPDAPDATQQEGSRLEKLLRQLEHTLEEAGTQESPITISLPRQEQGRPAYRQPATLPLPSEEEFEERESLEREPEVVSLETDVRREARRRFDQDDDAEQIEVRRISAAAARDKATSKVDHAEFDKRIRQEPADKTATGYTVQQLRDAMVWREILGPPVSLREESEK